MSVEYSGLGDRIKLPSTNPTRTLADARQILRANLETGKPSCCPVCAQDAKLYARKFRAPWLKALRALADSLYLSPREMVAICKARDYPALTYFGLAHRNPSDGMWRISQLGRDFLDGRVTLPSHAIIYNKEVVGFDETKRIHILDLDPCERFSLDELMSTKPMVA
ncbi:hypothetical protein [Hyphomicrobium sp.]|uniref:hypothetical protein n=1 Tax=Hyphomicrobium sp. TaxID=82 RepID=UPI001D587EB8|nr:hypothetical protein [Hyphomicrobium sp.]MBY0559319.1 hypothetical protein [Hyphomicrobium sp.]